MNQKIFNIIFTDALGNPDRDAFVSDWALSSIWGDAPEEAPEGDDLLDRAELCGEIYDLAHLSVADIRRSTGLLQATFAERFCIPLRTLQNWEQSTRDCAPYIRLMLARLCGLAGDIL